MQKSLMIAAALVAVAAISTPAHAGGQPTPKGPPQTMGDQGELPATGTVGGAVPEMGATAAPDATGATSTSPKGPPKTMGDEGKLPATGTVSGAVPEMTGPGAPKK